MKSVLIIKLGALGDVAMASAMLPALRQKYPDIHITWMAGQGVAVLLSLLVPPPQKIITIDEKKLFHGNPISRFYEIAKANFALLGKKIDLCLVPYRDKRYHLLHAAAQSSLVLDFSQPQWLVPGHYHARECLRLALGDAMDSSQEISFPHIALPASSRHEAAPDILLAPGGAKNALADDNLRRWPLQHYAALAKMLIDAGHRVGLIGNKDDAWTLPSFDGIPVTSYIGKTNLIELLGLLKSAQVLITHDTGPMHLMRLLDGKMIALFGPTRASEKMLASERRIILESASPLSCQPCYDGKNYVACRENICLSRISPATIFKMLQANFDLKS